MPKRNRANEQRKQFGSNPKPPVTAAAEAPAPASAAAAPVVKAPVDDAATRAAKMFAESLQAHEAADRAAREQARAETEMMMRHEALRADKQRAADLIKQLRGQSGSRQKMIDAEATYRAALAELQEFETGERPHWAPTKTENDSAEKLDPEASPDDSSDGKADADADSSSE